MQPKQLIFRMRFLEQRWYIAIIIPLLLASFICLTMLTAKRTLQKLKHYTQNIEQQLTVSRTQLQRHRYIKQVNPNSKPLSLPSKADIWLSVHRLPMQHWQQTTEGLELAFLINWKEIRKLIPLLPDLLEANQRMRYRIVKQASELLLTVWIDNENN